MKVNPDGTLFSVIEAQTVTPSPSTPVSNNWMLVSATVSFKDNDKRYYTTIAVDGILYTASSYTPLSTARASDTYTDKVIIGGPTGALMNVYKIQIFAPGSHVITPCNNYNILLK